VIEVNFIKNPKRGGIPARDKKFMKVAKVILLGKLLL